MARKRYDREFKISAVKLVAEQGYTLGRAAQSLGASELEGQHAVVVGHRADRRRQLMPSVFTIKIRNIPLKSFNNIITKCNAGLDFRRLYYIM